MYERILNFLIRNNFQRLNIILFKVFKFFLKKKIVLNFLKYKFYAYKRDIEIIINQIKNDNTIFIDIGCNYGAYSIPIAKLKNKINVYCIDPSEKALNQLKDNIKLNDIKNIEYFKIGVGEKNKNAFFNDEIKNYKNSGSYEISNKYSGKKILIDSIDNLIENGKIIPKKKIIVKMDVEGYEFLALQGMIQTIKRYDVFIFFEFSIKIVLNHDDLLTAFTKFLKENNLKIFNSEFYEVKIEDLFYEVKHLSKNIEVVGNYILSKNVNFN